MTNAGTCAIMEATNPVPVSYTHLDVYKRQGRGRNGIRGERQKTGVNFKGTENSEKSVVFMCLTLSNNDAPESEAGTLSGADIHPFMKIHAEQ